MLVYFTSSTAFTQVEHVIFDWWSKYYSSIGSLEKAEGYLETGNDTLIVSQHYS
jgi:hypothetical protein